MDRFMGYRCAAGRCGYRLAQGVSNAAAQCLVWDANDRVQVGRLDVGKLAAWGIEDAVCTEGPIEYVVVFPQPAVASCKSNVALAVCVHRPKYIEDVYAIAVQHFLIVEV